jgi:hypothetical protein
MSDPSNPTTQAANWSTGSVDGGQCVFSSDGYHVIAQPQQVPKCVESTYVEGDLDVAVNAEFVSGDGTLGIAIREQGNSFRSYFFEITRNGYYKIANYGIQTLQDFVFSSAIQQGFGVTNTLRVVASGYTFSFYANGQLLQQVTDPTSALTTGVIGCWAVPPAPNASNVEDTVFTNMTLYQLP